MWSLHPAVNTAHKVFIYGALLQVVSSPNQENMHAAADFSHKIEVNYHGTKTRSRRAAYSFNITHHAHQEVDGSPDTAGSYTWPEAFAPSRDVTPVPPPRLRKIRKRLVVPPSDRLLRSHARRMAESAALAAALS